MPIGEKIPSDLLAGRRAVIAGGTGSVGRVVVGAFLAAGATVVVPSRSAEKLAELRESLDPEPGDRLVPITGDLSMEGEAGDVREQILERAGPPDAVVASLGRFIPARSVLEAAPEDLQGTLDGYLRAHFMVARALLPALEERSGSYTFINGPLAFDPLFPGAGLVSIATAGQAMLARTVMKEYAEGPVRVNELVIHTRFGWSEDGEEAQGSVSQSDVGRFLAYLASERGTEVRGETIHLDRLERLRDLTGEPA